MILIRGYITSLFSYISFLLPKISWRVKIFSELINGSNESKEFLKRIKRERLWYQSNGNETFLLDYELDENSVVFDVGGYTGDFAAQIYCRSGANVYIFEPIDQYIDRLEKRFRNNTKIHTHHYALVDTSSISEIFISEGGNSFFSNNLQTSEKQSIKMLSLTHREKYCFAFVCEGWERIDK